MENELRTLINAWKENSTLFRGKLLIPPREQSLAILETMEKYPGGTTPYDEELLFDCLDVTGNTDFLQSLGEEELLLRWNNTALRMIRESGYSLRDLFESRVKAHPERPYFIDMSFGRNDVWSYRQINYTIKETAAAFYSIIWNRNGRDKEPRVAVISDNSVHSACCNLACLFYSIPVTPLNTHFSNEILTDIISKLGINIVVTDTEQRRKKLDELNRQMGSPFILFVLDPGAEYDGQKTILLGEYCKSLDYDHIEAIISQRKRRNIRQVATVMFTSGSTGMPKGVSFSIYNLLSKRFSRAAAVPGVGFNEVFLCYLPFFHTFGRFLELMGSFYWHGTYVFTGNPSTDTLMSLFPRVNPSIFISIPLRWQQLYERCLEKIDKSGNAYDTENLVREVTGTRLKWGLSAAGYLDPKVFQFFQKNGIDLCSGFGMTEATGGITMTPPGKYIENTTGIPLPGIKTKFAETGEMLISGHYIARYLEDKGFDDVIEFPENDTDFWMPTGDIFVELPNGYYEIVDRVKDIYKNNKGQTIAPNIVEKKFTGVPGIKNAFLVGDGMPYNTLLIVEDEEEVVFKTSRPEIKHEYYSQIINSANKQLAPYERIINFAVLERDFDHEKGELTQKNTFNRKTIAVNFKDTISELYKSNYIIINLPELRIKIPRWFYRDLSILEHDIIADGDSLLNMRTKNRLIVRRLSGKSFKIGDLEYIISHGEIDLGRFSLNPFLWAANPSMIEFCPCKEGWDTPLNGIRLQVFRPWDFTKKYVYEELPKLTNIRNHKLIEVNNLLSKALFTDDNTAIEAINETERKLKESQGNIASLIRYRLEALARHQNEKIRCMAYRILLVDEPTPDYSKSFPAFLESGLIFLNEESIEEIATNKLEKRRLEALRKRLFNYRTQLEWPADDARRIQLEKIFDLLVNFVDYHPEYYGPVRIELTNWIMLKADLKLSNIAQKYFSKLSESYETKLLSSTPEYRKKEWLERIVFEEDLTPYEVYRIKEILVGTTFIKQSVMLAFDENEFDMMDVNRNGIWVTRISSNRNNLIYRVSITTNRKKHYDLQLVIREDQNSQRDLESVYWIITIAGFPFGPRVIPKLGCCRPELGARSMIYHSELTLWEKIKEFSSYQASGWKYSNLNLLRKKFIAALSAYYIGWRNSGYQIVPGTITPNNVVVPELDYREGAIIMSIAGWEDFRNTLSIVKPMIRNFYQKTLAHYPWTKYQLDLNWIFDACIEAFGYTRAFKFFDDLIKDLEEEDVTGPGAESLRELLPVYMEDVKNNYYMPLSLLNAIDRYSEWAESNKSAAASAREETISELYRLYRLQRFHEIARYQLFRHTYFAEAAPETLEAFDILLAGMTKDMYKPATQFIELSDLQATLKSTEDRKVFSRLVFPQLHRHKNIDVLKTREEEPTVYSYLTDRYGYKYVFREPADPGEIGNLYRLFFMEKFPKTISDQDKYFIVLDSNERIAGGICYRYIDEDAVLLDGTVVSSQLKGRGIGGSMIDDFLARLSNLGVKVVKTHFYLHEFYKKRGFHVDKKWGALVKFLE